MVFRITKALTATLARHPHQLGPLVLAPGDVDGTAVHACAAGVGNLSATVDVGHCRGEHLSDLFPGVAILDEVTNQVHHLLQVIYPVGHNLADPLRQSCAGFPGTAG